MIKKVAVKGRGEQDSNSHGRTLLHGGQVKRAPRGRTKKNLAEEQALGPHAEGEAF